MSQPSDQDIKKVKEDIIKGLTGARRLIKMEPCWDIMTFGFYGIGLNEPPHRKALFQLAEIIFDYFTIFLAEGDEDTLKTDLKKLLQSDKLLPPNIVQSTSSKKSEAIVTNSDPLECCLGCTVLSLFGDRAIIELGELGQRRIKNIEYADAFWDWFMERTDIDKITGKILSDLEFGGKFPIPYDHPLGLGLIIQIMINEINKGNSSRRKQRAAKSLKAIGMRLDNDYAGLKIADMQTTPGMKIALQLVAKIEDYYNYRRVVQTIEAIAEQKISQQTIGSIRTSIDLLRRASENFRYGTNAYNTLSSIVWKITGLGLLYATSKQIGLSQDRLEDLIDAARNTLLLNRIGTPSDKSKTKIYIDCANDMRDLILHILSVDENYWNEGTEGDKRIRILLDIEESRIERLIANFKEATGTDLTDKKWLREEVVVSHDLPNKL